MLNCTHAACFFFVSLIYLIIYLNIIFFYGANILNGCRYDHREPQIILFQIPKIFYKMNVNDIS